MEKILSKKQQSIANRRSAVSSEYQDMSFKGSRSWAIVQHLAKKHKTSESTIFRDLVESKLL